MKRPTWHFNEDTHAWRLLAYLFLPALTFSAIACCVLGLWAWLAS